jgi:hypothetical protein
LVWPQHDHRARPSSPAGGDKFCDLLKLFRTEVVGGSQFGRAEGWPGLGPAVGSAHRGAVARAACCADRSLRKLLLAIIFRDDLPPKLVNYGSPERCHSAGAFVHSHGVIFESARLSRW